MSKIKKIIGNNVSTITPYEVLLTKYKTQSELWSNNNIKDVFNKIPEKCWSDKSFCIFAIDGDIESVNYISKDLINDLIPHIKIKLAKQESSKMKMFFKEDFPSEIRDIILQDKKFVRNLASDDIFYKLLPKDLKNNINILMANLESHSLSTSYSSEIKIDVFDPSIFKDSKKFFIILNKLPFLFKKNEFMKHIEIDVDYASEKWDELTPEFKHYIVKYLNCEKLSEEKILDAIGDSRLNIFEKNNRKYSMNFLREYARNNVMHIPHEYLNDKEFVKTILSENNCPQYINKDFLKDKEMCLLFLQVGSSSIWNNLSTVMKNDIDVLTTFVYYNRLEDNSLDKVDKNLLENVFILELLLNDSEKYASLINIENKKHKAMIIKCLKENIEYFNYLKDTIKENKEFNLELIKKSIDVGKHALPESIAIDKDIIKAKCKKSREYLGFILHSKLSVLTEDTILEIKEEVELALKEDYITHKQYNDYKVKYDECREKDLKNRMSQVDKVVEIKSKKKI